MSEMDLDTLRVFVTVAATGNMTRASTVLKVSQPAISKRLGDLEQQLGSVLFDRLPRGVRLTSGGNLLLPHAERILTLSDVAKQELSELAGLARGNLSAGASTTIGSYLIPNLFGSFHREHPGVRLTLEIANTAQIQAAVLENRVDLGLTEGFVSSDALEVEIVGHDEMVVIVAPGHPLLEAGPLPAAALTEAPVLMREAGSGTRDVIEAALQKRGLRLEPEMSLGSTEALKHAVAAGLGVAIVSRLAVALEIEVGKLMELPITDLHIHRSLHLLRLRGKHISPATEAFLALIRKQAAHQPGMSDSGYAR